MSGGLPGNPDGIRELARHWARQAEAAELAAVTLTSAKNDIEHGDLRLKGNFAPKIHDAIGDLPGHLRKLGSGYRGCSKALDTYATSLAEAQRKAGAAQRDRNAAQRERRAAESELDLAQPGWESTTRDLVPIAGDVIADSFGDQSDAVRAAIRRRDRAKHDEDLADKITRQAEQLRSGAENRCAEEIEKALDDSGLKNKGFWQKVGNYLKTSFTTWDGFVKLCENISLVLGVAAIFLSGPLALVVGGILLATAAVAMADKIKQFHEGKIGWKELALGAGMVVLNRVGGRLIGRGVKALQKTKTVKAFSKRTHDAFERLAERKGYGQRTRNAAHRGICAVTGHPVDIATGKVFTDAVDLDLPGPLPFRFERVWFSTSGYDGPLGHGWHHSYDAALLVASDAVLYRTPDGRAVDLLPIDVGDEYFERLERLSVARDEAGFRLRDSDGVTRVFQPIADGGNDDVVTHVLTDVVSRAGHRISLAYAESAGTPRLTRIVDSGGRVVGFEHDAAGRVVALSAPHPVREADRFVVARYAYDDAGNLTTVTDALGSSFGYEYAGPLLAREIDRTGLSFQFEYDGTDEGARCLRTWGDGGIYDHRLSYSGDVTVVVNSLGHATRHEHEGGLVVRRVDALGAETRTTYEYRQPVEEWDALGRVTELIYDHRGNAVRTVTPDGAVVETTFDESDLPLAGVDPVGGRWAWRYDDTGQLAEREDPLGRTWRFGYRAGLLAEVTDPAGGVTRIDSDDQGSVVGVTTPDDASSGWRRDRLGRPVAAVDPLGNEQRRFFDALGRVVRVEEADGNVRELSYDGEGNLLRAVDRLYDVSFTYQGMGRLATRTQGGTTVGFAYDTEEQLTGVVNEHGLVYRFDYGPTGEVTAERGFDDVLRMYERDVLGRVVSVRRASGAVSRYRYDDADRVVGVSHSDGTEERFDYRADGALALAENGDARVVFERDLLGRVTLERQDGAWVAGEYDPLGARVRVRSSMGADQVIERDGMGDVRAVAAGGFRAGFTRDAVGRELTRELPGGVHARWHRDRLGRPVRQEVRAVTGAVRDRRYEWDVDDRLRGVVDALTGPIGYEHDALGQLAAARFGHGRVDLRMPDAVGNLFRTEGRSDRVYGPAGQLLESTDESGRVVRYAYDAEGNLVSKVASDGTAWAYRWNAAGHLAEVERPDGTLVSFAYDALGRRVSKTFRGRTTRWIWDGNVPLHEWVETAADVVPASALSAPDTGGVAAQREAVLSEFLVRGPPEHGTRDAPITWLFEPESFAPMARLVGDRAESIVTDHLGTPIAMLDDTGVTTWSGDLSVWGDLTVTTGSSWHCPFRWPGQYEDEETGLYYNRFRYYDPESGQYTSQDPIGLLGGAMLTAYVTDPLIGTDLLGLSSDFDSLMNEVRHNLDFSTQPDQAVFYSGARNGVIARSWASQNGKVTIEGTQGGKYLDELDLFADSSTLTNSQAAEIWDVASARYASGASGEVNVFSTGVSRQAPWGDRTWWRIEKKVLKKNQAVTAIVRRRRSGQRCKG
jgi:RHS repeat-associated protein